MLALQMVVARQTTHHSPATMRSIMAPVDHTMLYARQRLLLNLLDAVDGEAANTDFQKWLFLYTRESEAAPSYEFVPYNYGCFSFTSYADRRKLVELGLLDGNADGWKLTDEGRAEARRRPVDVAGFHARYGALQGQPLVAEVYRRYPWFATRSQILDKVITDPAERAAIEAVRPAPGKPGIATIGYEGKNLEQYLNQLLRDGVTLLCDVRRNPLSRKYGFSRSTLKPACEKLGIRYEHLPELGIASDRRQSLDAQADYDALFADYERDDLPKQTAALERIAGWVLAEGHRVALTCFEREPHQCHRHCVADALAGRHHDRLAPTHL